MKKMLLLCVFTLTAAALSGGEADFAAPSAWRKGKFVQGVLTVSHKESSLVKTAVDPKLDYRISFEYRQLPKGKPGPLGAGFRLFDKQGREIRPYHVIVRSPVPAAVAQEVPKGSFTIRLQGASSWKKSDHCSLAFDIEPGLSDLPNFNTFESPVRTFEQQGPLCVITFKKPFPKTIPAGTLVRLHRYGGEFRPLTVRTSGNWQKAEFGLSGIAREGQDRGITQWQPGTAAAAPEFAAPAGAEIRNIAVKSYAKGKAPALKQPPAGAVRPVRAYEPAEKQLAPGARIKAFFPRGAGGFFLPGEELKFTVQLDPGEGCSGELLLYDYQGKLLNTRRFEGKKEAVSITFPAPGKNGYFPLLCRAYRGKTLCAEHAAGAVVMPPAARRDPWFGLNHNGLAKQLREGYKRLGIGTLGISFVSYHIDTLGKGSIDAYLADRDKRFGWIVNDPDFACYGAISTSFKGRSVASNFRKADPGNEEVARCIREDLFPVSGNFLLRTRELARRVALKYKGRISNWHAGEEIDASFNTSPPRGGTASGTLTAYILMAKQIYRGIKAGNPEAKVEVLGIAGGDWRANPQFPLCKLILRDLGKCFDGVFIDAYSGNWNSVKAPATSPEEGNLLGYLTDSAALSAAFGRPYSVFNGERGYACNYFESPSSANNRQLADYTARSLIIARSAPCSGYVIFKDMTPTLPMRIKQHPDIAASGFWDCDLWRAVTDEKGATVPVPRPVCLAVAVAARELAFTTFASRIVPGNGVHIFLFRREKSGSVAAVWTTGAPLVMECTLPAGTGMTDFQGNGSPLPKGKVKLRVTSSPFYLDSTASAEELRKALEAADYPVAAAAAGEGRISGGNEVTISLVNNSSKALSGVLTLPGGPERPVKIPPFAAEFFTMPLPSRPGPALFRVPGLKAITIPLDLTRTTVPRLKTPPAFDGTGAWMKKLPAIELKVPDHVRPRRALQWELGYFRSDGTDISVRLCPAWDDKYFYLGALVKDRNHLQRHTGSAIWQDDALQFALSTRFDTMRGVAKRPERNKYGLRDFSFGAALTRQGPYVHSWSKAFRGPVNFPVRITRKGDVTCYEVAVPWEKLKFAPAPGKGLRFSALVMNVDSPEQPSAPYRLSFGDGIAGTEDVSLFNTLILGK